MVLLSSVTNTDKDSASSVSFGYIDINILLVQSDHSDTMFPMR